MQKDNIPEVWGGIECTINRVGREYMNQLELNTHAFESKNLNLLRAVGIKTLRYPILWEQLQPEYPSLIDWSTTDARLEKLRELNIRPIVGLLHHGSGPRFTSLCDPQFPQKFCTFARAVAERYPWIENYTPINEPLTTARFSGLYGLWFPHRRDWGTFVRCLLNQIRAVALAMKAIRDVNPAAQLMQTEDLAKVYSTRKLRYQAAFENDRRWLTFDLLLGSVNRTHPLWSYLKPHDTSGHLEALISDPCPPDILGLNYYLTSERFLDHRIERYPPYTHGGNGRQHYADVEAVRAWRSPPNLGALIWETWRRYRRPMVISEVHLGCSREEQLRWIKEVWRTASGLRKKSVDLRAITAWALFGSFNWNSLLTRDEKYYEPGVFDARSVAPRPTALSVAYKSLSQGVEDFHPVLNSPGWWRRQDRLLYTKNCTFRKSAHRGRPIVVTGATGDLGRIFNKICNSRGLYTVYLPRHVLDIRDHVSTYELLKKLRPWALVNAAGHARPDRAENELERCFGVNSEGPAFLAHICSELNIRFLTFSSDLVFDGEQYGSYVETDSVNPLNVYGNAKAHGEARVLSILPDALIIRSSAFFGHRHENRLIRKMLGALSIGNVFPVPHDIVITPSYLPDIANASLDLLIDNEKGIWHLTHGTELTWLEFAQRIARAHRFSTDLIQPSPAHALYRARRPRYSALGTSRGNILPSFENAIERYQRENLGTEVRV